MTNLENYKKRKLKMFDEHISRQWADGGWGNEDIRKFISDLINEIVMCIPDKLKSEFQQDYPDGHNACRQEFFDNLSKKTND